MGFSLMSFRRQMKRKTSLRKQFVDANVRVLKLLQGTRMLFVILLLVAIAAACTISQIALEEDVEWVVTIENIITFFFIAELGLRLPVYIVVHRELDTFFMDPLNICDILVVTIDNPPVNALGVDVRRGLVEAIAAAEADAAVKAVLITGSGAPTRIRMPSPA